MLAPEAAWAFHTYSTSDTAPKVDLIHIPNHRPVRQLAENAAVRAARGGKSDALLMDALRYVDIPGYSAIIFRRTLAELDRIIRLLKDTASDLKKRKAHTKGLEADYKRLKEAVDRRVTNNVEKPERGLYLKRSDLTTYQEYLEETG